MADIEKNVQDGYEQMVRRRFAELDKGNFAVLDEMFDPAYRLNFPASRSPLSLDATKRFNRTLYAAFPDLTHTITEQISARDKVVTRWFAQGTHRGTWMGVAGTGKIITLAGINIYTIKNGKLAESHVQWDLLGLLQQLDAESCDGRSRRGEVLTAGAVALDVLSERPIVIRVSYALAGPGMAPSCCIRPNMSASSRISTI